MLSSVEKYAGRRPEETWGELQSRSSYKELVRQNIFRYHSIKNIFMQVADLKDVHVLFSKMEAGGPDLPAHLFLIAPKIDFRQISAPNFLADS